MMTTDNQPTGTGGDCSLGSVPRAMSQSKTKSNDFQRQVNATWMHIFTGEKNRPKIKSGSSRNGLPLKTTFL